MTENPFEMFTTPNDYVSWDRYVQQTDKIKLTATDRQRVRDALKYFRSLMGEDFIQRILNSPHPFLSMITNAAPRERISLAEVAEQLQRFANVDNFDSLKTRLGSANTDEFAEGLSVLTVAHKLKRTGFAVSFEPKVSVTQKTGIVTLKRPDIKISNENTGEDIYVEVSQLLVGDSQRKSRKTFQALFNTWDNLTWKYRTEARSDDPLGKGILPNIKFYRSLTDDELRGVAKSLDHLGQLALSTNAFTMLSVEGVIDVGIAPPFNHEAVHEWAKTKHLNHPPVEGPPIQTDEVQRAIRKIFDDDDKTAKKWQIPDAGPGIVVLETNKNLILFTHDIRYVIGGLEQAMITEPKLNYVILTLRFSAEEASTIVRRIGNHAVVHQSRSDGSQDSTVIISNPRCTTSIAQASEEKLIRAFGGIREDGP
jgi:hypothetical protein